MTRASTKKAMESHNQFDEINTTLNLLLQKFEAMEGRQDSSDARFEKLHRDFVEKCDMGFQGNSSDATPSDPDRHADARTHQFHRQDSGFQPRPPLVKLDFPRFHDGDDPLGWVYKAEHYFDYFDISADKKVRMASFHMENKALQWFQWVNCVKNYPKWEDFTKIFCREFGSSDLVDCTENLVKLRQTGLLRDYIVEFRRLANRTSEMTPGILKSCFIGGLKPEIRHDVKLLRPFDVHEAIAYSQQVDAKLSELKVKSFSRTPFPASQFKPPPLSDITNVPKPESSSRHDNFRRLTAAEIEFRRKNRLCFNCDEKFSKEHVCAGPKRQILLMDVYEPSHPNECESDDNGEPEVTACAVYGMPAPKSIRTMKVNGLVLNCPAIFLIDSGSSHNFIDIALVKQLRAHLDTTHPFSVKIANGGSLTSPGCLAQVSVRIQHYAAVLDFYALPLGGCDIVLGVQWLRTLGPVLWDFDKMVMQFVVGNSSFHITSPQVPDPQSISSLQMDRLLIHDHCLGATLFVLQVNQDNVPTSNPSPFLPTQEADLQVLLNKFQSIFQPPSGLPPSRSHDHRIPLIERCKPPSARPYKYGPFQKTEIEKCVKELLDSGFIRPSHSPFSSPVLLVKKKEGTWRMCMDYRALNLLTIKDKYPIPLIDELLDEFFGATYFSKLDLRSGYHQIRMHPQDIDKTSFRTHEGHYEFLVMPFGLTNAPASFQGLMNKIFRPYLRKFILVFFDDILIYSASWELHLQHLSIALSLLQDNHLFVKLSKCAFGKTQIEYLGHKVSQEGVDADPSKLQAIAEWPIPVSVKALRGFLGLTGYYRKFIPHYGSICSPLTQLTKKDGFHWSPAATVAFQNLKNAMLSPTVLALPDFSKPFIIESDASGTGIGAVLQQDGRPIAFTSQSLSPKNRALSTYEREMLAVIHAIKKWQPYLLGNHFIIRTDHHSLKYFLQNRANSPFQQKWVSKLLGFDYEIQYRKGSDNKAADALSRMFADSATVLDNPPTTLANSDSSVPVNSQNSEVLGSELTTISYPYLSWLDDLRRHVEQDDWILAKLQIVLNSTSDSAPLKFLRYHFANGFLRYKNRIVLSPTSSWRAKFFEEHHCTPSAGHAGFLKTYKRISRSFYWEGMKNNIKDMVSACAVCQKNKYESLAPAGLLNPLPIPQRIWIDIYMDFITGLPPCKGKSVIFVVVDRFSKATHFLSLSHPYTAHSVAQTFIDQVFKLHGMPTSIVSDRDPIFISSFWKEFFKLQGSKLCLSFGFHPQTDGQTEVLNRCLETYLWCFCSLQPKQWLKWLPWAEWSYNTSYHTATKLTPYEVVYGQPPPHVPVYESGTTKIDSVDQCLQDRNRMLSLLKTNLESAQLRMKRQADKHRTERSFDIGDFVYLRLVPYQQKSLTLHPYHKLHPRFFCPFEVLAKVGPVAYKLKLPPHSKIHPVFHVSCLKKQLGMSISPSLPLPSVHDAGLIQDEPAAILDRRVLQQGSTPVTEVLVHWQNHHIADASWESLDDLKTRFPDFQP